MMAINTGDVKAIEMSVAVYVRQIYWIHKPSNITNYKNWNFLVFYSGSENLAFPYPVKATLIEKRSMEQIKYFDDTHFDQVKF